MARIKTSCSWCHSLNALNVRWCVSCGHAAHLARLDCDCRKCAGLFYRPTPSVPAGESPTAGNGRGKDGDS